MQKIAFLLACLSCPVQGQRLQVFNEEVLDGNLASMHSIAREQSEGRVEPMRILVRLLRAVNPTAAFSALPASSTVGHSKMSTIRSSSHPQSFDKLNRRTQPTIMQTRKMIEEAELEEMVQKEVPKINELIEYDEMRVTVSNPGGEDENLGILSKEEALEEARKRFLDLVIVTESADPVVCKICSYDKQRYKDEKKAKQQKRASKKGGSVVKELKISYKVADNDFGVVKKKASKFLEGGNKVKFTMKFNGREVSFKEQGADVLLKMASELKEIGVMDSKPMFQGRTMQMAVSPKRKEN